MGNDGSWLAFLSGVSLTLLILLLVPLVPDVLFAANARVQDQICNQE